MSIHRGLGVRAAVHRLHAPLGRGAPRAHDQPVSDDHPGPRSLRGPYDAIGAVTRASCPGVDAVLVFEDYETGDVAIFPVDGGVARLETALPRRFRRLGWGVLVRSCQGECALCNASPESVRPVSIPAAGRLVLLDDLLVCGTRWKSLLCDRESCCPAEGVPCLPPTGRLP